jgi:hypothetical protein
VSFRGIPTYGTPLAQKQITTASWYRFFQDLAGGRAPAAEFNVKLGTSPYVYHSIGTFPGFLIIKGATVTKVEFTRDNTNYYDTGTTQGIFPMDNEDSYRITYTGNPVVTFVPM